LSAGHLPASATRPHSRDALQPRFTLKTAPSQQRARLQPVERLEPLTLHDLARQEEQKLELLRNLLTYYHYAARESREEVLRAEINRVRAAADDLRERYRAQYNAPVNNYRMLAQNNVDFEEAHTTVINGKHRRDLS